MDWIAKRVVIAGGSGFLGRSLATHLAAAGATVTILSRKGEAKLDPKIEVVGWDARTMGEWAAVLEGAAGLVNLTGRSVDCIKTPDHADEILRSRVESTRVLGMALQKCAAPPPVWVQMSTAHIYGDPPLVECDELASLGFGLAPTVGMAWEKEHHAAIAGCAAKVRSVVLRTSFVIGRPNPGGAGALGRLGLLAKCGLGGTVGSGEQGMSWIHERDMNRIFAAAIENPLMEGIYNATAPTPVSNRVFMRELRLEAGGIGGVIGLPAFEWMVRIGAPLLLRTDPELALYGRYVVPRRLEREGFSFEFPDVRSALRQCYAHEPV